MSVCSVLYILVGIPTSTLTFPLCQQDCCFYCRETTTKKYPGYSDQSFPGGVMYKRDGNSLGMERVFTKRWLNHSSIFYACNFTKSLLSFDKSFTVRWDQVLGSLSISCKWKKSSYEKHLKIISFSFAKTRHSLVLCPPRWWRLS